MSRRATLALLTAGSMLFVACSGDPDDDTPEDVSGAPGEPDASAEGEPAVPELTPPGEPTTVVAGATASEVAVAASEALFGHAPVVVLAPLDDVGAQARAASVAVQLGVPLLLGDGTAPATEPTTPAAEDSPATEPTETDVPDSEATGAAETPEAPASSATAPTGSDSGPAVTAELTRLGTTTVLDVGGVAAGLELGDMTVVPAPDNPEALHAIVGGAPGVAQSVTTADLVAAIAALQPGSPSLLDVSDAAGSTGSADAAPADSDAQLPSLEPAAPLDDLVVLVTPDLSSLAGAATARATGARVQVVPGGDPRVDSDVIAALATEPAETVLALGAAFGTPESLRYRLDVAATGVELAGGGQVLYPGRHMIALYGNPTSAALGVLGEQPVDEAIVRAQETAAQYDDLWDDPVIPAFELISTVASEFAGPDGNYSTEMSLDVVRPWVEAAGEAGVYVVLDLQPGRTDFLTQAQIYEELLALPHVGLALDPEWRLEPDEVHLRQIGSVSAAEINEVSSWLADLTRDNLLPQKLLILHQFRLDMIENRDQVDTSRDEVAVLIHADGNGPPGSKFATYDVLTRTAPPNVWWGWKNFYDEDSPTFTPEETVEVDPTPVFVSYQ